MLAVWNWILNTFIRDLSMTTRTIISIVIFCLAVACFMIAIKKKSDSAPLSIGWTILCVILLVLSSAYLFI